MAYGTTAAVALLLSLCAAAFATDPPDSWIDIPFVQQGRNGCGPASIAMVMQYWQARSVRSSSRNVAEIVRVLQPDPKQGVRASAMVHYFEQNEYRAFAFSGAWADLEREVAKGRPVIVALKPDKGNSLHYVVIAGVNNNERVVLLNDPAQRKLLKEDRAQFEQEWKVTGFWTLLALPEASSIDVH
jgi:ABC-type bacteriocin/lantibiotic exporter with double-glycine peptidase domain